MDVIDRLCQFLSSRPDTSSLPFKPTTSRAKTLHPDIRQLTVNGIPKSGPDAVAHLEDQVNGS